MVGGEETGVELYQHFDPTEISLRSSSDEGVCGRTVGSMANSLYAQPGECFLFTNVEAGCTTGSGYGGEYHPIQPTYLPQTPCQIECTT